MQLYFSHSFYEMTLSSKEHLVYLLPLLQWVEIYASEISFLSISILKSLTGLSDLILLL